MMSFKLPLPRVSLCFLLILVVASPAVAQGAPVDEQQASAPTAANAPATAEQGTAVASRCQRCGDGYCARSCENEVTCPADCAPQTKVAAARCGKCGDGQCVRQCGETPESCPADCGYTEVSTSASTKADECTADKSADPPAPRPDPKKE